MGDRPDANDTDATINTAATVRAAYDANGNGALDNAELKSFLAAHKGITAKNVYYIAANGSNDTGKPNNPKAPYRTWHGPRGSATYGIWQYLQPGDVVIFQGGTYEEPTMGGGAPSMKSGAAGRPIVVMSMPGENVLFNTINSYTFDTVGSHDLIIDGFNIDNPKNTGLGTGWSVASSANVIVRNIESQRFNYISSIDNMRNVTVEKVVIHHNTEHGLYFGARDNPSRKITIKDSIFYKNGVEAGYGNFQYNGRVTEMVIDGNIFHSSGQWGISLKQGVSNSVIRNNLIFNNRGHGIIFDIYPGDCSGGTGICPYDETGNLIVNNTIWVGKYNLNGEVTSGNMPTNAAAILVARNVGKPGDGRDQGNNTFQNNILVTFNGPAFRYTSAEWLDTTTIQNNVIFRVGGDGAVAEYGAKSYSFASLQSTWSRAHDNVFGNPLFQDVSVDYWGSPARFNFSLMRGSPAINLGLTTGAPAADLRGKARITPPDAGAYEQALGSGTGK